MGKDATHLTAEAFLKQEGVDTKQGLSTAEVEARRAKYGSNELEQEEPTPLWKLVLEQFDDQLVQILLGAAGLSTVLAFSVLSGRKRVHQWKSGYGRLAYTTRMYNFCAHASQTERPSFASPSGAHPLILNRFVH